MKVIVLTALISVITQCETICRSTNNENQGECSSAKDVKYAYYQDKWTEIKINSNLTSGETVETNLLQSMPKVKKIVFQNNIYDIENNAFEGATFLRSLHFYMCRLLEIKTTWFSNLPITSLVIFNSKVTALKPKCFYKTPNLKTVNLSKNSISKVPTGVFSYTNIEILFLNENQIEIIEEDAFYGMGNLKRLALENNLLTSFEPEKYIGNTSPNIYMLWLSNNYIKKIHVNNFKLFPKLRILLLHFNELYTIEEGAFYGANQLSYLDISNNNLSSLSHKIIPEEGLEYMDIFLIQNNRLSYLSTEIISNLPRLSKMAIGGNPWQCSCYNEISKYVYNRGIKIACDKDYMDGKRPVCVIPEKNYDKCLHNISSINELYQNYNKGQNEYEKLPPLCNIDCMCYANHFTNLLYEEIL